MPIGSKDGIRDSRNHGSCLSISSLINDPISIPGPTPAQTKDAIRDSRNHGPSLSIESLISDPISIPGPTPAQIKDATSLSAPTTHNQRTTDVTFRVQTASHNALAESFKDQSLHDDHLSAAVATDNRTVTSTQIPKRDVGITSSGEAQAGASESSATSGLKCSRALTAHASDVREQRVMQEKVQTGVADQAPVSPMADKSLQNSSDVHRAVSACKDISSEAPNACTTTSKLPTKLDFLQWKCTPFTLEPIGDGLYCPRLIVNPKTALSRVLPPACYPLDSAILLINKHRRSGGLMPSEANSVLIVYDELHRLDFSDINITLLDPKLFGFSNHSLKEKEAFHKQLGGWIDLIGQNTEIPGVYVGTWYLETVQVDYTQFQMSLCLSKRSSQVVFDLPFGSAAPPRRDTPWQVSFS